MNTQRPWVTPALCASYLAATIILAVLGQVRATAAYYLTDVVLTLPMGVVAFVLVYPGYAALQGIGGLFAATTTADGSQAPWLSDANGVLITLLFCAAAVGNLLLLRRFRRRHLMT